MKLEAPSKKMLAITKSKAKMYEFAIDEASHIALPVDPRKLLITTIGILGDLSAFEAREDQKDEDINDHESLKADLISAGQYFDALIQSHLADEMTIYLKIIGSAAYYLADMSGSSIVLAKSLPYNTELLTDTNLEGILIWILKSDFNAGWYRVEDTYLTNAIDRVGYATRGFFSLTVDDQSFKQAIYDLRKEVYKNGSDRELLFVDIISSVLFRKFENSSIICLPKYTQIPIAQWVDVILKPEFVQEFWPAQKLLGGQGVLSGISAVVQMPTSAGKTKSTELIIRSSFLSKRSSVAVIVAPFRALCREITAAFELAFGGEDVNINELQDVLDISDADDELIKFLTGQATQEGLLTKSIVVTTPEKLVYLLRHEPSLADSIGLLIFDEWHQFDTGRRGVTYELLMAYLKTRVGDDVQKVLISAVMANANSIGEWLNGETGIEIQGSKLLPTIRSTAFASWQTAMGQLQYIDQDREADRDFFVPRVIEQINLGTRGRERKDRLFPDRNNNPSVAAYLGVKLCHQGPVAIFCGVKSTVTSICDLLVNFYDRGLALPPPSNSSDQNELDKIAYLSSLHFGEDYVFTRSISLGVLPHSSNIPNGIRVSVEWAMESNKSVLVVCTSTLAQGVNLPIRYLVVSSTFQAGQEITTRDFHNLIGRAGRAGYHTEGSVIFADTDVFDKRNNFQERWRWQRAMHLLDFTNAEDCASSLLDLIAPFDFTALNVDVIQFISDPGGYRQSCIDAGNQYSIDIRLLLDQMDYKETLIEGIESYFLSYLKDNPGAPQTFFDELAQGTLAYYLSGDDQKENLRAAFSLIASRVLTVPEEKRPFFGKSLLGLRDLFLIEVWLDENWEALTNAQSSDELLVVCWSLLSQLNHNKMFLKIKPEEVILEFSKHWIAGSSYVDLYELLTRSGAYYQAGTQQRAIKMDHVIDLSDGALSFDSMLYIGAIADVAEGKGHDEDVLELLRRLQTRLKLGLSNNLEMWLYSRGYVDREICKKLAIALHEEGVDFDVFDLSILDTYKQSVSSCLSGCPTYFSRNRES
ncbi:MAG: DEAD/DEAH box helicase [Candidatus Thiodiazotropha endolucinida]|uniref:DEAD/DEAH box helicase n=1 Tax=Candidatus Thiodiazotropha taylori TaxID=2792791 RepID=A0A9E4NQB5_9GAMM|nr:DEAD/DEAH box helicase [Candidatus Thiodiazotropha taylori]MCW4239205.1 DEAD/DEAH box helicase [Candidatus Thiodiazotropha endolucinida]